MLSKLRLLWHVLRGYPLMYRVHVVPGKGLVNIHPDTRNLWIEGCHFDGMEELSEAEQARVNRIGLVIKQEREARRWKWLDA